ncbi:MAG: RNA polymerase sigma factor [Pirellulaceae bacterium]
MDHEEVDQLERVFSTHRAYFLQRIERRIGMNPYVDFAAEDVLQEAFADAHRAADQLKSQEQAAIVAWLEKIVDNRLAQTFRDRARLKRGGPNWRNAAADGSIRALARELADQNAETGSDRYLKREVKDAIRDAIQALPDQQQRIVTAYYLDHQSLDQIAAEEELTKGAVRSILFRAKQTIKELLGNSSRWYSQK